MRGELLEAGVRVDAPYARARDRLVAVEREPGCVSEQMPDRRAFRPRRLVQVDDPLLGGDERRERDRRLRDRRPAKLLLTRATLGDDVAAAQHGDRDGARAPALDLRQRLHAARY